MPYIFVVGAWGAGTSAVASVLDALGWDGSPPYWRVPDPKTPCTYESRAWRRLMHQLVSETSLEPLVPSPAIARSLAQVRALIEQQGGADRRRFFKHTLSALMLEAVAEAFDARFIFVMRSPQAIEATRQRRGWDERYGLDRVRLIEAKLHAFRPTSPDDVLWVSYSELIAGPAAEIARIAMFAGVGDRAALERARLGVRTGGPETMPRESR